jgi:hypothetical protein
MNPIRDSARPIVPARGERGASRLRAGVRGRTATLMVKPSSGRLAHPKAEVRRDAGAAFLPDPFGHGWCDHVAAGEELEERLAEDFVASVTSGADVSFSSPDRIGWEELGGPFLVTSAQVEFGATVNEADPPDGERSALPTAGATTLPLAAPLLRRLGGEWTEP